jgi:hypothetical protein
MPLAVNTGVTAGASRLKGIWVIACNASRMCEGSSDVRSYLSVYTQPVFASAQRPAIQEMAPQFQDILSGWY